MSKIRKNIFANTVGRVWGLVSVYLFVPLYLKFLGVEAYGLVGFYATLMAILVFADMGFTATLNREMARLSVQKDSTYDKANLLRTYESTYAWISLVVAILIWSLAPIIANYWLKSNSLDSRDITTVIRLMGISIAFQLPSSLYIGGLIGLQKQIISNSLQISWSMLRGFGSLLILWLVSPTITAFACWQLFANIVYCFSARATLWRVISARDIKPRFRWSVFQNTWRYALGMASMALLSMILMQADKLTVSKILSLETFGYYMLAVTLAGVPRMLVGPIGLAVFPRFTGLVAADDRQGLVRLYRRTSELIAVVVIPGGLTLAMFSGEFLVAWTGNPLVAEQVSMTSSLLIAGELMQAITLLPYYLCLAHGNIKLNLQIGIASVLLVTPLLIFLIMKYGVVGAGISWFVMNVCTFMPYMYFVHQRFLPGELVRWCLFGVMRPLFIAFTCVFICRYLLPQVELRMLIFGEIAMVWAISAGITALFTPELRQMLMKIIYKITGVSYETS